MMSSTPPRSSKLTRIDALSYHGYVCVFFRGHACLRVRLQDEYNLFLEALLAYKDMEASVAPP